MSLVVALDDIPPDRIQRTSHPKPGTPARTNITFFRPSAETRQDTPSAYITRFDPGQTARAHFHVVDQFQIILEGKGKFGRHDVAPYYLHFSRAYTPYGPLTSDPQTGWAFLGLRSRYDPGAQQFPGAQEKLKQIPDRRPWQTMKKVIFPEPVAGIVCQEISEIQDDRGLFAYSLSMPPRTQTTARDPSHGDGQFVVVLNGSLMHQDKEQRALTVAFIRAEEDAFQIRAGDEGLNALVLNLPSVTRRPENIKLPATAAGFKKWQCILCDFAYDEALGMPQDGIPAGTRWQDVPATWTCPDCSAAKSDFQMVEV